MRLELSTVKKVAAWRVISIVAMLIITFLFVGEIQRSFFLTLVLTVVMTVLHYIFEEVWNSRVENSLNRRDNNGK
jgi:uncharacterized membrane protein